MKRRIIFYLIVIVLLGTVLGIIYYLKLNKKTDEPIPINKIHGLYYYDGSTLEKAMGTAKYAFVAKINKITKTEYRHPSEVELTADGSKNEIRTVPYTFYEIQVLENRKGNLITDYPIELMQLGGISQDKKSYYIYEDSELLKVGKEYIVLATADQEGGIIEQSDPRKIIEFNEDYSKKQETIVEYKKAYENEEVPEDLLDNLQYVSKYDINYQKK